ncbi:hypothetical protein EVAR_15092_1 [Eumeta japonica]|uniref:Uncharacterized protein n=1 Tax=Eumeta variegata TaxID=151549 RepID=A0A4C1UIU2_EUMVA|nr:hypothetical protein EVAR_15092_1 [Eumeta japonica]
MRVAGARGLLRNSCLDVCFNMNFRELTPHIIEVFRVLDYGFVNEILRFLHSIDFGVYLDLDSGSVLLHNSRSKVTRLQRILNKSHVGLSGKGFFYLKRNALLKVMAMIITYELVLIQMDSYDALNAKTT